MLWFYFVCHCCRLPTARALICAWHLWLSPAYSKRCRVPCLPYLYQDHVRFVFPACSGGRSSRLYCNSHSPGLGKGGTRPRDWGLQSLQGPLWASHRLFFVFNTPLTNVETTGMGPVCQRSDLFHYLFAANWSLKSLSADLKWALGANMKEKATVVGNLVARLLTFGDNL